MNSYKEVQSNWFEDWFNTPYYHILYKHRDDQEAHKFIDNLVERYDIHSSHKVLDVACGKGRFAKYISLVGCDVTGIDISLSNIELASEFSKDNLTFIRRDMRNLGLNSQFDYVLNMFTSFGYFDKEEDNLQAIKSMVEALKPNGVFVLDFFNTEKVKNELPLSQTIEIEGINFSIHKYIVSGYIIKDIRFTHNNEYFHFQERVQALTKNNFIAYFEEVNLSDIQLFGDYDFNPWTVSSDRTIFIARKKSTIEEVF